MRYLTYTFFVPTPVIFTNNETCSGSLPAAVKTKIMTNRKAILFGVAVLATIFTITTAFLRDAFRTANTSIYVNENAHELSVTAKYPDYRSPKVHRYLARRFSLGDVSNLEIKNYYSRDGKMNFYIRSTDGYLKIKMSKVTNTGESIEEVKKSAKELGRILTQ